LSRIAQRFERLKQQQRKALVPYLVAGDPAPEVTVPAMHALVAAGADIIELGVPFSDPMAEGPVIQVAHERALEHDVSLSDVLSMVEVFRREDSETPVVLMGYANPVEAMGYERFAKHAARVGVDGILTVDLPPEEGVETSALMASHGIDSILLLAPTTTEARIEAICAQARGYLYYVSLKGVTGAGHLDVQSVSEKMALIRRYSTLPVAVGFGIKDEATASAIAPLCDGVVVGSALVQSMVANFDAAAPTAVPQAPMELVSAIRSAIDTV
jgi:tryptophan synthase alpha chain